MFLLILVTLFLSLLFLSPLSDSSEGFQSLSQNHKSKLLQTLDHMHKIFNKHQIWYVIAFGTLLGAVRHRDLIPWDDDADIIVLKSQREKIWKAREELEAIGCRLVRTWKLDRIHCYADKELPFIDLFYVDYDSNGKSLRCTLDSPCATKCCQVSGEWWWKSQPLYKEMNPRRLYKFGNTELYGPAQAWSLLKREYGNDCLTHCMTHNWDHTLGRPVKAKKIPCGKLDPPQWGTPVRAK